MKSLELTGNCQLFFLIPALFLTACSKHKTPPVVTTPP